MLKVIKTQEEYEAAAREAEQLVRRDPPLESPEGSRLELLAFLISVYEDEHFPIGMPEPVEAILFRMEQEGLTRRDLVPYIGSRSKVSEVLSGKRRLTLKMIRALHTKLGIPAEILLQEPSPWFNENAATIDWDKFPIKKMTNRGWFDDFGGRPEDALDEAEELVTGLFARARVPLNEPSFLRQHVRSGSEVDSFALAAWCARVMELAHSQRLNGSYSSGSINNSFMAGLVSLSNFTDGPKLAMEYLLKNGIHFIMLAHLPRTHLDGAAMLLHDGTPLVALTLRYDRLDNFWFSLCHELAHVSLHLGSSAESRYFDNFEAKGNSIEDEADNFAEEGLIPQGQWDDASVRANYSPQEVRRFAEAQRVHPAIVAGRLRRELANYRMLWPLVGNRQVRIHFPGFESGIF